MVKTSRPGQWNVLELSSFQLETTETFRAHIGAALNVTPDHLDRHYTLDEVRRCEGASVRTQRSGDFAVLNADETTCAGFAAPRATLDVWFRRRAISATGLFIWDGEIRLRRAAHSCGNSLARRHNVENTMAAAAWRSLAGARRHKSARR